MMKLSGWMCCSVIVRVVIHFLVAMLNMMSMTVMVMYIWMPMIHSDLLMANIVRWWVSMTHVRDYCIITRTTMRIGRVRLCRRATSDRTTHRYVLGCTRMCNSSPWGSFLRNNISLKVTRTMKVWRRQLFIFVHFCFNPKPMYVCAFQLQVNKESQEGRKDKRYQTTSIPPPGHSLIHN